MSNTVRFAIPLTLIHTNLPPVIFFIYKDYNISYNDEYAKECLEDLLDSLRSAFVEEYEDTAFERKKFSVRSLSP